MKYMNDYDMELALRRASGDVQIRAARFLIAFCEQVNEHSDGWAYWRPASAGSCQAHGSS